MCLSKPLLNQPQRFNYKFRSYHPCGKCGKHCDSNESLIITCGVCEKNFHRSCVNLSKKKYLDLVENNHTFICDRKCWNNALPFSRSDNIDFFSALYGENEFPCSKCRRDCLKHTACIQCSICDIWDHFECSGLTEKEFLCDVYYFCSPFL